MSFLTTQAIGTFSVSKGLTANFCFLTSEGLESTTTFPAIYCYSSHMILEKLSQIKKM